jgi:hypothetical protein
VKHLPPMNVLERKTNLHKPVEDFRF